MVLVNAPKKRASVHHKRRHAQHHKHNDHYLKTYWPYLPLTLIVGLGVVLSSLWGPISANVLGYATSVSHNSLLDGTNAQRASNGLGSLAINGLLNQAAQAKANDMVARNYWSHNTPEGNPPWIFFSGVGYQYQTAGENLAYGFESSEAAIEAWMNSPGHRANILNNTYQEVGFGFANSADYQGTGPATVIVAMYGSPYAQAPAPAPTQPKPAAPAPQPVQAAPAEPEPQPAPTPETNATAAPTETEAPAVVQPVETQNVSRIQLLAGRNAPWSMFAVSVIAMVSAVIFLWRHSLFWHRALVKGEAFVVKHKLLDVVLVAVGVLGFVLTRSAGVIH